MSGPSDRPRRSGDGIGRRLLPLGIFAMVGVLVWLAHRGRYDAEIDRIAAWLQRHFDAIAHRLH